MGGAEMKLESLLGLILDFLEKSRRGHDYCDDCWYTCPEHPEGCCNDDAGNECNCGANKYNEKLNKTIETIKAFIKNES